MTSPPFSLHNRISMKIKIVLFPSFSLTLCFFFFLYLNSVLHGILIESFKYWVFFGLDDYSEIYYIQIILNSPSCCSCLEYSDVIEKKVWEGVG